MMLAMALMSGSAAASTPGTACGTVINAPGEYHLPGDLGPCAGDGVVIDASNVTLDLQGFMIAGVSTPSSCDTHAPQVGINAAVGSGVLVTGGTVTGFVNGVVLFASHSRVTAMRVAHNCVFGLNVSGTGNSVDNNRVTGSGLVGAGNATVHTNHLTGSVRFGIVLVSASHGNIIHDNVIEHNGVSEGGAIGLLSATATQILRNLVTGNFDGISVQDSGNLVDGNTATDNVSVGIAVSAGQTVVHNNTAIGNGTVDLSEATAACGTNTWQDNVFATDSVAGVSDGGPGAGCIRGTAPAAPLSSTPIAVSSAAVPGGTGVFTAFPGSPALSAGMVASLGVGSAGEAGVYRCDSAIPTEPCLPVADRTTAIPGGIGAFTAFGSVALAAIPPAPIHVAFLGSGAGQQGVYSCEGAAPTEACRAIADRTTAIPGGAGTFTGFTAVSTSAGHTAFLGQGAFGQAGIYLASTLTKVVAVGDTVAGKVVTALRFGTRGLDGGTLTFGASFADGSEGVFTVDVRVLTYAFAGFFPPVANLPVVNRVKAGAAVPVKFSLHGDQGLAIFALGSPRSQQIACDSDALVSGIEATVTAGGSSLSYDPATDRYTYVWKTQKAWANTCRQLVLQLKDGRFHRANFTFK